MITNEDFQALQSALSLADNPKMARALIELWINENYYPKIYKQAWLDCCDRYDIEDDYYTDNED